MSSVSFIGLGGMARVMAARAVAGGYHVELIGRDAANAKDHGIGNLSFPLGVNLPG